MKVLLDENLPQRLRHGLIGHEVLTVGYLGWDGLKNGDLLLAAESDGFEVVVTGDQKLRYQQNLKSRKVGLIVLTAIQWRFIKGHVAEIMVAINDSTAGSFQELSATASTGDKAGIALAAFERVRLCATQPTVAIADSGRV